MKFASFTRQALLCAMAVCAAQFAVAQEAAPPVEQTAAPEAAQDLKYSNKWRVEVSEGAHNDGIIRLRLTPKGEAAIEVTVNVKKGRYENGVAHDIRDALRAGLDAKRFHAEVDDGEDVLVKKKGGPDFALQVVEFTLKGTRLHLERE